MRLNDVRLYNESAKLKTVHVGYVFKVVGFDKSPDHEICFASAEAAVRHIQSIVLNIFRDTRILKEIANTSVTTHYKGDSLVLDYLLVEIGDVTVTVECTPLHN